MLCFNLVKLVVCNFYNGWKMKKPAIKRVFLFYSLGNFLLHIS